MFKLLHAIHQTVSECSTKQATMQKAAPGISSEGNIAMRLMVVSVANVAASLKIEGNGLHLPFCFLAQFDIAENTLVSETWLRGPKPINTRTVCRVRAVQYHHMSQDFVF